MAIQITSLEELHAVELEAMLEVDRVCKLHGIRWFLHGGTMLGALRHGGPIPWDDDVDIAMLHDDYVRFVELAVPDLDPRFTFTDHSDDTEFFDFVPRITDTAYEYPVAAAYADKFSGDHSHPDMDIFVFESACTGFRDSLQSLRLSMSSAMAMGHRDGVDHSEFSGAAKIASYILPTIGRRRSLRSLIAARARLAAWGSPDSPTLRVPNDIPRSMGFRFERSWYDGERRVPFSGEMLPVPAEAEKELEVGYGPRWTELPKPASRHPEHADLPYVPDEAE